VLVGPSGCGKSTLLRMIAGLEEITSGEITIGGTVVNKMPPKQRDTAMVFQNYALYPHMKVFDNMAFSLILAKVDSQTIDRKVRKAADILNLGEFLDRYPRQLSGGQRQRVAMGRAIVRQMRTEIRELHQRLSSTSIYVTHDQIEAMTMADRIVVMRDGYIEQIGEPLELYDYPANIFVAGFIGSPAMNLIEGTIRVSNGATNVVTDNGTTLPLAVGAAEREGQRVYYGLRPQHFTLVSEEDGIPVDVSVVEPTGAEILVVCHVAGGEIQTVFKDRHVFKPGQRINLAPMLEHVHLFDAETQKRMQ
jgi:multiple sugar transport system ATP-binding protein